MTTLRWILDVNAPNAAKTFDEISTRMTELDRSLKKTREIAVGDRQAMATFARLQVQADRFKDKIHSMPLTLEGAARAEAQLLGLEATADRLNGKLGAGRGGGGLSRVLNNLIGGGGGAAGGAAGVGANAAGAAAAGGGGGGGTVALVAGAAGLATLLSGAGGILPLLTAATAGLAAFAALALPTLTKLIGNSPAWHSLVGVFNGLVAAFKPSVVHLFNLALGILAGLLPQILPFANSAAKAFATLLHGFERFARSPAFGLFLNQMNKLTGPAILAIGTGFGKIAIAFGRLLIALTSPDALRILSGLLTGVADAITWLADIITWGTPVMVKAFHALAIAFDAVRHGFAHNASQIAGAFDIVRHASAVAFDAVRHAFDDVDHNIRDDAHNIAHWFDDLRHTIATWGHSTASVFDTLRHNVAASWDTTWNNTVARAQRGVGDVMSWVGRLPGQIKRVFSGAGTWLLQAGKNVIQGLLNGLMFVWHKVTSFISSIAGWIKSHKGPIALDQKLLEPAGRALMSGLHTGLTSGFGLIKDFIGGVGGFFSRAFSGGGSVAQWISRALAITHSPMSWLPALERLVSLESGGNPLAHNPSGASGLFQTIPSTFAAYSLGGSIWNPVADAVAGIRYLRATYGSPYNIPGLFSGNYHGYALGGVIREPILGFGRSGRMYGFGERGPETVIPGTGGSDRAGPLFTIENMTVQDATDIALVSQRLSFAITAASLGS